MKEGWSVFKPINEEIKLILPEGTPVYIIPIKQIAFYESGTSIDGASKIKNVGVVPNEDLRKPTAEELLRWGKLRDFKEDEIEKFIKDSENWDTQSVS